MFSSSFSSVSKLSYPRRLSACIKTITLHVETILLWHLHWIKHDCDFKVCMLGYKFGWLHVVQTGVWHALVSYKEIVFKDNEKTFLATAKSCLVQASLLCQNCPLHDGSLHVTKPCRKHSLLVPSIHWIKHDCDFKVWMLDHNDEWLHAV